MKGLCRLMGASAISPRGCTLYPLTVSFVCQTITGTVCVAALCCVCVRWEYAVAVPGVV